jgi:hypothetical protein
MGRRDTGWLLLTLLACVLFLVSCCPAPVADVLPTRLSSLVSTALPTPIASTAQPTWTPTPSPTQTPSPVPTIQPDAVAALTARGRAKLEARGVDPLCLRWDDTDGDGEAEWIGLHFSGGLQAFVLDGEAWYDLQPLAGATYGLGAYPTCELEIRDVNADGTVEVLIWGHAGTSTDLLHIFIWDGVTYVLLAPFEGEAGVQLVDNDGDLIEEVLVRYDAGSDLVWEAVYTWDGAHYGWTWERYSWRYLDRPHAYPTDTPERTVISYYLALDDRDTPAAFDLLSLEAQTIWGPYDAWAAGFATTVALEVGSVHEQSRSDGSATVIAQVRAYDNVDGRVIASLWDVTWTAVRVDSGWRLDRVSGTQLDEWEATYYP